MSVTAGVASRVYGKTGKLVVRLVITDESNKQETALVTVLLVLVLKNNKEAAAYTLFHAEGIIRKEQRGC